MSHPEEGSTMRRSVLKVTVAIAFFLPGGLLAQTNARYTFSIDGPCVIVGPPGSVYDDGAGGVPYFTNAVMTGDRTPRMRPGHTWDVVLTTEENIIDSFGACGWIFSLGVDGALRISDFTLDGTTACSHDDWPECRGASGLYFSSLAGPPDGCGPQTEENRGAVSYVVLKFDCVWSLPPMGKSVVAKVRVSADFPQMEGEITTGRIFFTTRVCRLFAPEPYSFSPFVAGPQRFGQNIGTGEVTLDKGDPPLTGQECVVQIKASSVAAFVRCDANEDGQVSISDAVWLLNELFRGGARTRCRPAADCDGDGEEGLTDVIRSLSFLFLGGPPPPAPFSFCDRIDVPVDECPPGSTACP